MTLGLVGAIALTGCSGGGDDGDDVTPTGVSISSFTATPTMVSAGGTVQLAWNVVRAESVTINAEPGGQVTTSTDLVGSVTSGAINANTTFTLSATGGGRTVMQSVSVTVGAGGPPTIQSFTASPTAAGEGTTVTLRWSATNGNQVRILQGGTELLNSSTMANGGSLPVTMGAADTTWNLEVSNAAGMATSNVTVTFVQATSEVEPNNDAASANDANLGGGVRAELTAGDEDWYSFSVTEGGNVFAETADVAGACTSSTADTVIELIAPDGTTVLIDNDDGPSRPCSQIDPVFEPAAAELPAGTYYIRVTGYSAATTGSYRLVVVVGEGPACGNGIIEAGAGELCDDSNAVSGDGCSSTCGAEVSGAGTFSLTIDIPPEGSLIPLVLTSAGQSITATTSDGNGACPYPTVLVLGNSDLQSIGQDDDAGGCANFDPRVDNFAAVLEAGTYYIFVAGETEAEFGPLTLDITISNPACGNGILESDFNEECEDGNTMSGDGCSMTCTVEPIGVVTGLDQDMTFTDAITPAGSQDFFQVVLPSSGYIRAETGIPTIGVCDSGDTVASVLDSAFVQLARNDEGGPGSCSLVTSELLAAGTYYVRIEEFLNDEVITSYQVRITTFGVGCGNGVLDAGEQCDDGNTTAGDGCNASCNIEVDGTVTGINQNQSFSGAITPAGESDTYAVVLPASGGYIRAETGAPTIGTCMMADTVVTILDNAGTQVGRNDDGSSNSPCSLYDGLAQGNFLPAGTYFVQVTEYNDDGEIAAYQLNIQTSGAACGNGALEPGEQCDDGNTTPGDGCNASCMFEGTIVAESEPNDATAMADASGATIGTTVTVAGSIGVVGDLDYFSFTVPSGMTASVRALTYTVLGQPTMCTLGDTNIFLLDSAGNEITSNDDIGGGSFCSEIDPTMDSAATGLAAGTYYIRVQDYDNTATFGPYYMDITLQ